MDRVIRIAAIFDIEADRVHDAPGVYQRGFDRDPVANIRMERLDLRIALGGWEWMAGSHTHAQSVRAQVADDVAAEETGTAEYRDEPVIHGAPPSFFENLVRSPATQRFDARKKSVAKRN